MLTVAARRAPPTLQLDDLQSKSATIAGTSKAFYGSTRTTRRQLQWQEYKAKIAVGVAVLVLGLFFWVLFGGGDDDR